MSNEIPNGIIGMTSNVDMCQDLQRGGEYESHESDQLQRNQFKIIVELISLGVLRA